MARAEYGVPKQVFAVSIASIPTKSQVNLPTCESPIGIDQIRILISAIAKIPKNIYPSRLPKNLFFVLSDKYPTSGSLTPSQSEEMAIAMPTSEPEIPITAVAKNMIKLLRVCDIELYPNPPMA